VLSLANWLSSRLAEERGKRGWRFRNEKPLEMSTIWSSGTQSGQHRRPGHRDACPVILGGAAIGAARPVEAAGHELRFIPSPSCPGPSCAAR
jgi:hypothetical protein